MPKYRVHLFKTYNKLATVDVEALDEFHAEDIVLLKMEQGEDLGWQEGEPEDAGIDYVRAL